MISLRKYLHGYICSIQKHAIHYSDTKILSGISQINLWKPFQTIYIEIRMKLGLGSHKVLFDCKLFKQHIICYIIRKDLLLVNEANL